MTKIQDQFAAAGRDTLENQLAAFSRITSAALDGYAKLCSLNLNTYKTSVDEAVVICRQLLNAKNPQEAASFLNSLAQPTAEKGMLYSRHLVTILSGAQSEVAKAAEEQLAEANRSAAAFAENAGKSSVPGSHNVIALVRTAMDSASAGYGQFSKTAREATEAIESNLQTAAAQFVQAAEKPARTRSR